MLCITKGRGCAHHALLLIWHHCYLHFLDYFKPFHGELLLCIKVCDLALPRGGVHVFRNCHAESRSLQPSRPPET